MIYCVVVCGFFFLKLFVNCFSQASTQQHSVEHNDAAMELINSVTGVDEEGRSRQRILTFAAKRYRLFDH